eukprot:GILJ01004077.1.p1 GENE.GILJ01004077.1~~GILJ01004077.1.p1  ORF type:complete len:638 (+),score=100.13 GILJ01004077.1:265-1914(+)
MVSLLCGKYLIAISEARLVGRIKKSSIFLVKRVQFLALPANITLSAPQHQADDKRYLGMIETVVAYGAFYFAYDFDITHTLQRISAFTPETRKMPIWKRADKRFFWNFAMIGELAEAGADDWILPVINGFFQYENLTLKGKEFDFVLLSRRDRRRTGTRFHTRGCDSEGNAANFAESEQIVVLKESATKTVYSSFVQTRGSMTMIWNQKPNLKYMPKGKVIGSQEKNDMAAKKHYNELVEVYGDQVIINLIDKKGNQKEMGEAFTSQISRLANPRVKYFWFDFHHECRKMQWQNLSRLVDLVKEDIDRHRFFVMEEDELINAKGDGVVEERQFGAFRTNCMDCLDRTNVVQSVFARRTLHTQLNLLGLLPPHKGEPFEEFPSRLEYVFKNMWADHADVMSFLYSGTGALKTDFTRTGRRTKAGAFEDGRNSVKRYFLNNFYDGDRQDCIDFFVGKYKPDPSKPSPLRKPSSHIQLLFLGFTAFMMVTWAALSSTEASTDPADRVSIANSVQVSKRNILGVFLAVIGLLSAKIVVAKGTQFVDKPRLCPE